MTEESTKAGRRQAKEEEKDARTTGHGSAWSTLRRRHVSRPTAGAAATALLALGTFAPGVTRGGQWKQNADDGTGHVLKLDRPPPSPKIMGASSSADNSSISDVPQGHGIDYHGGPVLTQPVNVYFILYGDWSNDTDTVSILTDLVSNIGGSPLLNTQTSYYDGNLNRATDSARYAGSVTDNYSQGTFLTLDVRPLIIENAIRSGALGPPDPNGLYILLPSADNTIPGFPSVFCGTHGSDVIDGVTVQTAEVFNPKLTGGCSAQGISPNDNPSADAMAMVLGHELGEAISDPQQSSGWYSTNAGIGESGDKCEWQFGPTQTAPNGSLYNVTLGNRNYLLQQLWVNEGDGYCGLQRDASVPSGQEFQIVSKNSGKCVNVAGDSSDTGAPIVQYTCGPYDNESFAFTPVQGGYRVDAKNSGLSLNVSGGFLDNGGQIIQFPYWGDSYTNEVWAVSAPDSQGYVTLQPMHSARPLSVSYSSQEDGAPLIQWEYLSADAQKWQLVPVNGSAQATGVTGSASSTVDGKESDGNAPSADPSVGPAGTTDRPPVCPRDRRQGIAPQDQSNDPGTDSTGMTPRRRWSKSVPESASGDFTARVNSGKDGNPDRSFNK